MGELLAEDECPVVESRDGEEGFPIGWRHQRGGSSCREAGRGRRGTHPLTERAPLLSAGDGSDLMGELLADGGNCFGCSREQKGVFRQNSALDLERFTGGAYLPCWLGN